MQARLKEGERLWNGARVTSHLAAAYNGLCERIDGFEAAGGAAPDELLNGRHNLIAAAAPGAPMTPAEMDSDMNEARVLLGALFRVERCTHANCDATALWVFDRNGVQIASVARNHGTWSRYAWRANKIRHGQPITELPFERLSLAAAYVARFC